MPVVPPPVPRASSEGPAYEIGKDEDEDNGPPNGSIQGLPPPPPMHMQGLPPPPVGTFGKPVPSGPGAPGASGAIPGAPGTVPEPPQLGPMRPPSFTHHPLPSPQPPFMAPGSDPSVRGEQPPLGPHPASLLQHDFSAGAGVPHGRPPPARPPQLPPQQMGKPYTHPLSIGAGPPGPGRPM
eukprot:evm.model.scf_1403.1 EVM.evm.TU.scf_1403.1   scf_1403:5693-7398(+)